MLSLRGSHDPFSRFHAPTILSRFLRNAAANSTPPSSPRRGSTPESSPRRTSRVPPRFDSAALRLGSTPQSTPLPRVAAAVLAYAAVLASPRRAARPTTQIDHAVLATSRSSSCGRSSIVPYPFSRLFHSFDRAPVLQFVRRCLAWCSSAVLTTEPQGVWVLTSCLIPNTGTFYLLRHHLCWANLHGCFWLLLVRAPNPNGVSYACSFMCFMI